MHPYYTTGSIRVEVVVDRAGQWGAEVWQLDVMSLWMVTLHVCLSLSGLVPTHNS